MLKKSAVFLTLLLQFLSISNAVLGKDAELVKLLNWELEQKLSVLDSSANQVAKKISQELGKEIYISVGLSKAPPLLGELSNLSVPDADIRISNENCADYLLLFHLKQRFDYELDTGKKQKSKKTDAESTVWRLIIEKAKSRSELICDDDDFKMAKNDPRIVARLSSFEEIDKYTLKEKNNREEKAVDVVAVNEKNLPQSDLPNQSFSISSSSASVKKTESDNLLFSEGLAYFQNNNGLYGYQDRYGNVVIRPKYLGAGGFYHGRAVVKESTSQQWGYIDKNENWIVRPQYCMAGRFSEGLAAVYVGGKVQNGECSGGKWGFIDTRGKMVIAPKYERVWAFSKINGIPLAKFEHGGFSGYINQKGEWVR